MDIVSHGMWGGVLFGRRSKAFFSLAVLCGMLPDLLSFGVFTVATVFGLSAPIDWSAGPPPMEQIPSYVHLLYNITHSLVTFSVIFGILWFAARSFAVPFSAYGFAILLDIPTHSTDFFATPFLWPLSSYQFDGVPWSSPYILYTNFVLLIGIYIAWFVYARIRKRRSHGIDE